MGFFQDLPTVQNLVHYVMADADYGPDGYYAGGTAQLAGGPAMARGHHRPAVIVETWGSEKEPDPTKWSVNLVVFVDGTNDGHPGGTLWRAAVKHSEDPKAAGTWHFPERA